MALNTLSGPCVFPPQPYGLRRGRHPWRKISQDTMPIYDFRCQKCGHEFEAVVRPVDTPECPACHGQELERLLSSFAVNSPERKQAIADRQVKKAALNERQIQGERDREAEQHKREEHEQGEYHH